MRLAKLLGDTISNIDVDVSLLDLNVAGVTCDSRKLNNDYLFGALPGSKLMGPISMRLLAGVVIQNRFWVLLALKEG